MGSPLWFVDLENYAPGNENVELAEMLLDLKENVKLRIRVDIEGVLAYIFALTPPLSTPLAPDNCGQIHMWLVHGFPLGSPPEGR